MSSVDKQTLYQVFQAWPAQLKNTSYISPSLQAAQDLRLGHLLDAESKLYSFPELVNSSEGHFLLYHIYQHRARPFDVSIFRAFADQNSPNLYSRFFHGEICLLQNSFNDLNTLPESFWHEPADSFILFNLCCRYFLKVGDYRRVINKVEGRQLQVENLPLVSQRYYSQALFQSGQAERAISILDSLVHKSPNDFLLRLQLVEYIYHIQDGDRAIGVVRDALNNFGDHPELLVYAARAKLHQREPGIACRLKLIEKVIRSTSSMPDSPHDGNLLNSYDHLGRVDWLQYLLDRYTHNIMDNLDLFANLNMQLSSFASDKFPLICQQVVSSFLSHPPFERHLKSEPLPISSHLLPSDCNTELKVVWITGDVKNHPVCRFLLGILSAQTTNRRHHHIVISLQKPCPKHSEYLQKFANVEVHDASNFISHHKTQFLRSFRAHIAVDLTGWTGGNHVTAWMARVAPVQVNYLGFHASTGIPQIDFWLGDKFLFPDPMKEWCSEQVVRLPRPFIAWCPPSILPEGCIDVTQSPNDDRIRFGCFNHFRKVSDRCLSVWSQILHAVPNSCLVLKGVTSFDSASRKIIDMRLARFGINPSMVEWLSLTPTPSEHLQQYTFMDIALDTFPNSGCTTTCEALWMGVPVITLSGERYVELMSSAVLAGANLTDLITNTEDSYIAKAVQMAHKIEWLRSNRSHWRNQLINSDLYDATGLFNALEQSFTDMAVMIKNRSLL